MKNYQYCYLMAMLAYIAAQVTTYKPSGFIWAILSLTMWVCGLVLCCKNK